MSLAPDLISAYRSLWSLVQAGATMKDETGAYSLTSADVVSVAAQLARDAGQSLSFAEASAVPTLFSLARSNDRAAVALTTADLTYAIDSSMVGQWPTAAPVATQAAQPQYLAKAEFTYVNALGETSTGWVTMTNITQLPTTAGQLQLQLQGTALKAYAASPAQGGTPKTDAEVLTAFGEFTSVQLYAV